MKTTIRRSIRSIYRAVPCKKELFTITKWLCSPPESVYRHLHFAGPFTVADGHHVFRMVHYGYILENEIFWEGPFGRSQRRSLQLWSSLCREADVVFDIGANTGLFSLLAKSVRREGSVYAFEPIRAVFDKLVTNCRLNDFDVHARNVAVSSHVGSGVLYDSEGVYTATLAGGCRREEEVEEVTERCQITTLAAVIEQEAIARVDLMKIDVEGYEPEVLEGMSPYLDRMMPTLLIEITNDDRARRIEAILEPRNYLYFDIDEDKGLSRVPHLRKSSRYNYLICGESVARSQRLI